MKVLVSLVKLEIILPEFRKSVEVFPENRLQASDVLVTELRQSVVGSGDQLLNAEMSLFLGEPDQADNKRMDTKSEDVRTNLY